MEHKEASVNQKAHHPFHTEGSHGAGHTSFPGTCLERTDIPCTSRDMPRGQKKQVQRRGKYRLRSVRPPPSGFTKAPPDVVLPSNLPPLPRYGSTFVQETSPLNRVARGSSGKEGEGRDLLEQGARGSRGKGGGRPLSGHTQSTGSRDHSAHGNIILSVVNNASSSLQVNSGFPHLTNSKQIQATGTFTISCQITVSSMVNQNETELNPNDDEESESLPEEETSDKILDNAS